MSGVGARTESFLRKGDFLREFDIHFIHFKRQGAFDKVGVFKFDLIYKRRIIIIVEYLNLLNLLQKLLLLKQKVALDDL